MIKQIKLIGIAGLFMFAALLYYSQNSQPELPWLYQFRRLQEKFFLKLQMSPQRKYSYELELASSRFKELVNVTEKRDYGFLLPTAERYFTTIGELTELVVNNNMSLGTTQLAKMLTSQQTKIQQLIDSYPKDKNGEWKYLEDDKNYIILYLQKLKF